MLALLASSVAQAEDWPTEIGPERQLPPPPGPPPWVATTTPFRVKLDVRQLSAASGIGDRGDIVFQIDPSWAPNGANRLLELVSEASFYDDVRFFRVISGAFAQFGINGDPGVTEQWWNSYFLEGGTVPNRQSNLQGTLAFGRNSIGSNTQVFINLADNTYLDQDFIPIGSIVEGLDVALALHATGEGAPVGTGPSQELINYHGNEYLDEEFPELSYVRRATLVDETGGAVSFADGQFSSAGGGISGGVVALLVILAFLVLGAAIYWFKVRKKPPAAARATSTVALPANAVPSAASPPPPPSSASASAPPPPGALPPGWSEGKDPASGAAYFYNAATKETQWTRPEVQV